jgi:phospholipid/cholesterol/gamma-HCH transport system substrate-binding protein
MVQVYMLIYKKIKPFIKKNARASIGSEGLMGDKVVEISPGTPDQKEIENNDSILCEGGNGLDEIMAQVKIVAQNAAQITGDLAGIVDNIHQGKGSIGKLFMDSTFAKNLDQTVVNIKEGAGGFKENMDAAKHNFLLRGYFKKKEKAESDSLKAVAATKKK